MARKETISKLGSPLARNIFHIFCIVDKNRINKTVINTISEYPPLKPDEKITVSMDTGVVGHVARTGEIYITQDIQKDPNFCRRTDKKTGYVTRGILCFPIRSGAGEMSRVPSKILK